MKKICSGIFLMLIVILTSITTAAAASSQLKVDGMTVQTDVKPEIKNNQTMVPLRVISENLGAKVHWSDGQVILTQSEMKVSLKLNSSKATVNGKSVLLDAKPYLKNGRTIVPLRFLAEIFGCKVHYDHLTISIDTEPLMIKGMEVKALLHEYHMTMGGVVEQINGNAYMEEMHRIFTKNMGKKIKQPNDYTWSVHSTVIGGYYKMGQYDFLNKEGSSIARYDVYSLVQSSDKPLTGQPDVLIYDATVDQWYEFNKTASDSIYSLMETATRNGFVTVISNTVP
ncbi:stalk domain-containing protein [Lysinibacillus capsici]|uniref:stalk domain-containing protein n=1 Tax=Lysinibacillus capsici TaxID=2115968 RepID=UPI0029DE5DDD|nr:stalk domain-containing protein [Lysinibacillus capsici]WPK03377.1 stalk domain-containing protein [Lysinibacillus capsici]